MTKRLQLTLAAVLVGAIIVVIVDNLQSVDHTAQVAETPIYSTATAVAATPTTPSTVATAAPSPVTPPGPTPTPPAAPTESPSTPLSSPTPGPPPNPTPTAAPAPTSTAPPAPTPIPTPTPVPTPSPPDALALAKATLISKLGVNSNDVLVLSAERVEWPSTALGCPEPGVAYAAVIVSGWKFTLAHRDQTYTYHSDESGSNVIECTEPPMEIEPGDTVNLVEAAGLDDAAAIVIYRFDAASGEYKEISEVTDPGEIATFISILDLHVQIVPATECQPIFEMTFVMPGRSETFQYICPGINTLFRGGQSFWGGGDGVIPLEFGRVFGPHASKVPLPLVPSGQ